MRSNLRSHLAMSLALATLLLSVASLAGWVQARPFTKATSVAAPGIVSYQGQIVQGETPYDGTGYFRFAIVDADDTVQYWSNDGHEPPTGAVALMVSDGLFSVNLGDIAVDGMALAIGADVFQNPYTRLRVWFSPDNSDWTQLPDQMIAAVPYALRAQAAADADTVDGQHAAAFQLRVSGVCAEGQAVRAVNGDGTVVCEPIPRPPTFTLSTLDSDGRVGYDTSIAVGADGLGLISYRHYTFAGLNVAHCDDTQCSSATFSTVDAIGDQVAFTSIAIGADGLGLISYHAWTNHLLKVAHCGNLNCSSASAYTLDTTGTMGFFTSLAIGTDGLGLISYYDGTNGDLKVAHCNNAVCSSATLYTLDATGEVGTWPSIAIGTDGLGLISYYDATNAALKVAHCNDTACSSATLYTVDAGFVGYNTAIAIGADGLGLISYHDYPGANLRVAHCSNIACSSATSYALDDPGNLDDYLSIAIGSDGLGLISYLDGEYGDLKVAHCDNTVCSSATYATLDSTGVSLGAYSSIAIGTDGLPLISYLDGIHEDLKVAHCSNELCIPINWGH